MYLARRISLEYEASRDGDVILVVIFEVYFQHSRLQWYVHPPTVLVA